jgi:hypothetical protein
VTRTHAFKTVAFTKRFAKSYGKLGEETAGQCDDAILDLQTDPLPAGLRMKPIRPSNVYYEVRINSGDRLVIYPVSNTAYVMDVVTHDEIKRWGTEPAPTIDD